MSVSVLDTKQGEAPVVEVAVAINFIESKAYNPALTRLKRLGISEEDAITLLGEQDA